MPKKADKTKRNYTGIEKTIVNKYKHILQKTQSNDILKFDKMLQKKRGEKQMKSEKGITVIALLLIIVIILGCIFAYKVMSNKNNTENTNTSSIPNTSTSNNSSTNNNNNSPSTNNNSSNTTGLRKEFKDAMDSYESAMDEYIAFMTKYNASKGTNPELIAAYGEYMKKYIDATDAFKKWDGKEMNKEEAKYYVDVQTRVTQKLMNASIDMSYQ